MKISAPIGVRTQLFPLGTPTPTVIRVTLSSAGVVVKEFKVAYGADLLELDTGDLAAGSYVLSAQAFADLVPVGDPDRRTVEISAPTVEISLPSLGAVTVA